MARLGGSAMEWSDIVENAGVWAAALGIEVIEESQAGEEEANDGG